MAHRIREGMTDESHKTTGGLGGANKVVEADETYVGGKAKNRAHENLRPRKRSCTLIERDGRAKSFHVANVTAKTVRPLIITNVNARRHAHDRREHDLSDDWQRFANHLTVNHSANEYARLGGFVHINTARISFPCSSAELSASIIQVSEAHLHRYLAEFDFRYNNRSVLGVTDGERAAKALKGIEGKRLTYRIPRQATNA